MAQHDSRQPAASRTVISLSDGFSRRLSPVSLPFSPVYLAGTGPKPSTNQPLGSFAASKHRLKTAKTVATPPDRIDGAIRPGLILL
jgi:hypothetical protein